MNTSSLKVKSRLWIVGEDGTYLGEGRIALLQAISTHGSISQAARSMKMSYLKAWNLVESMNKAADKPLVIRTSGGKGGGGTLLTEEGKKAIALYSELNKRSASFLDKELQKLIKTEKLK